MKKLIARLAALAAAAGVAALGYYLVQNIPGEDDGRLPLAEVQRGDLTVLTHLRGELRAVRSITLTAPNLGSQSQVIALAPAGALAQRGDLIFALDESERIAALEDAQLEVEGVRQQLRKAETELEIRKQQDEVELTRAEFDVRRWELENRRNELISSIDARKNELSLDEARQRKAKLEDDIKNRLAQREAELAVLREQLSKARLDVERERRRIAQARVPSPITGLVSILENRSGGRGGFGTTTPTIREGDQIPAGMSVAQLLDLSEMELVAKVEEVERAYLSEGMEALIKLDALPGKVVKGRIKRLGTTAAINVFRGEATKKFDCVLSIDMRQLLTNVGAGPAQIERILAAAKRNAEQGFGRRPAASGPGGPAPQARSGGQRAGGDAGRTPGAAPSGPGGAPGVGAAPRGPRGGPGGGGRRQITPEMQARLRELTGGREMSELSPDERRSMFQQIRALMEGGAAAGPGGGFTQEQLDQAQLPKAPEEGSDVDILLRPGLLADAEVTVENLPDVVYIPFQAVVDTPRGPVVYTWNGSALEPRPVELGRRSESQIVITAGLDEGDLISLEPPVERREERRKKADKKAAPAAIPGGFGGRGRN